MVYPILMKRSFPTELSYLFGIVAIALGTALAEKADFGLSMIVAPAYILHLKISEFLPFFSFGMAEYSLQAVILILLGIMMKGFRISYLFSFITAVVYGFVLDGFIALVSFVPADSVVIRLVFYAVGMLTSSLGVSFMFHTYLAPEAYELFVKEGARRFSVDINKFKTGYDSVSCLVAIILSFTFFGFGHFEGVKLGTVFCALFNGSVIGMMSRYLDDKFEFVDKLPYRSAFTSSEEVEIAASKSGIIEK